MIYIKSEKSEFKDLLSREIKTFLKNKSFYKFTSPYIIFNMSLKFIINHINIKVL
jgi:hypothetical protein